MPRINLIAKFGQPILTQTYPAIPPGSRIGDPFKTQHYPAIPPGSAPGTPLDVMTQTAAAEFTKIYKELRSKRK